MDRKRVRRDAMLGLASLIAGCLISVFACVAAITWGGDRGLTPQTESGVDSPHAPWDIVLVAGQSNAWETDYPAGETMSSDPEVLVWKPGAGEAVVQGPKADELGFAFAREYAREMLADDRKVVYVRLGYGHTGFSTSSLMPTPAGYRAAANGTWDRELVEDPNNRALETVRTAGEVMAAAPEGSRIVAMLWSQGEIDRHVVAEHGTAWYANKLDDLIDFVRSSTETPRLPVIVMSQTPEIVDTPAGALIDTVHEDTPRRVLYSAYVYGPEGYTRQDDPTHFASPGHTVRGELAVRALARARMNVDPVRPGTPLNPRVSVSGDDVEVRWEPPYQRVEAYRLEMSTDGGRSWALVELSHAMATHAVVEGARGAGLIFRVASSNAMGVSQWSSVVGG